MGKRFSKESRKKQLALFPIAKKKPWVSPKLKHPTEIGSAIFLGKYALDLVNAAKRKRITNGLEYSSQIKEIERLLWQCSEWRKQRKKLPKDFAKKMNSLAVPILRELGTASLKPSEEGTEMLKQLVKELREKFEKKP